MFNEENFNRAIKIKGYGSYNKSVPDKEISKIKFFQGQNVFKVKPTIIRSLKGYINFVNKIDSSSLNPVFFRGQTNADYLITPNCLRTNPQNEHLMIEAFTRKFYNELSKCQSSMEKLMLMQHFNLPTRCLDITENPVIALYFACSHMKKFRNKEITKEDEDWGEVILFREQDTEDKKPERLKSIESSNISIIANTAFMEDDFTLWQLGTRWKKDVDIGHDVKFIDLRSIVRQSYIARVPHNNPRIKNQQGAFIMVNANMAYLYEQEDKSKELTEEILQEYSITVKDCFPNKSIKNLARKLHFKKIKPYSDENEISIYRSDPFDLQKLFYKKNKIQQVALIPPDSKSVILDELKRINISEDFVYPDMDNVANEINEQFNKKYNQ